MKIKFITQNVCAGCEILDNYLKNAHPDVEVETINIDKEPGAIEEYDVMGTPIAILWDEDFDEEVTRHVGFRAGEDEEHIDELIDFVE